MEVIEKRVSPVSGRAQTLADYIAQLRSNMPPGRDQGDANHALGPQLHHPAYYPRLRLPAQPAHPYLQTLREFQDRMMAGDPAARAILHNLLFWSGDYE